MSSTGDGATIVYPPDAPLSVSDVLTITNSLKVGLTWVDGVSSGGTSVIDYIVQYQLNGVWTQLDSGVTSKPYTTSATLVAGDSYLFRVIARNSVGTSLESDKEHVPVLILVAQAPAQPLAPTTTRDLNTIIITWQEPVSYGNTAVISYTIQIRKSDNVTFSETTECNGALPSVRDSHKCTVLISTLTSSAFSLAWGEPVYAKVLATNIKGPSPYSPAGNGDLVSISPDVPTGLNNVPGITTAT